MKKIIFLIVLCFSFFLYGEIDVLEIFPRPVNGKVASDKVTVKGYFESSVKVYEIRLRILTSGVLSDFINQPELAVYPEENEAESSFSYFYYIENIPVSASGTRIYVEKLTAPNFWDFVVSSEEISYQRLDENSSSEYKESMRGRIANESFEGEPMHGIFYFGGPDNKFYRGSYSRIPRSPLKYLWQTYDDVDFLFNEMKDAGVNTIKMSYWGDWDENDPVYKSVTYSDGTVVKDRMWISGDPGFYKLCDFNKIRPVGKCFKMRPATDENAVNTHEMEICGSCIMPPNIDPEMYMWELNRSVRHVETRNAEPECLVLSEFYEENNCWSFSVPKKDGGFWDATNDSREVVFQTALLKDMTVVPVIEESMNFTFSPFFPNQSHILKNRIKKLLGKYGNYESWLEMYDKNGERRKAVFLLHAIYYGFPMAKDLENEFDVIADEIFNETGHKIGFILDTSPLGETSYDMGSGVPFHNYTNANLIGGTYVPQPEDLRDINSFLAINPFNITSDTGIPSNTDVSEVCSYIQNPLLFDDAIRLCNSDLWLKYWYEESGLPLIATVVPGFDDRLARPGFSQYYGDSDLWNHIMEKSVRQYNTAGITLDIWNGFTEGYVFVPMLPFFNKWNITRTGHENYEFAKTLFGKGKYNIYYTDEDQDGVVDSVDNCLNFYNPPELVDLNTEFAVGETGSVSKEFGDLRGFPLFSIYDRTLMAFLYFMQPDSDLDGIGDACDYKTSGAYPQTEEKLGFANSMIADVHPQIPKIYEPISYRKFHKYATIKLKMPVNSGYDLEYCENHSVPGLNGSGELYHSITCNAAVHYCAINKQDFDLQKWGDSQGHCSTSSKEGGSRMAMANFGYSHGSDDFSKDSILSWQRRISIAENSDDLNLSSLIQPNDHFNQRNTGNLENDPNNDPKRKPIKVKNIFGGEARWNWRKDWLESNNCLNNPDRAICQSIVNGGAYNVESTMYYALSTSVLPVGGDPGPSDLPSYILVENDDSDALETDEEDVFETNDDDNDIAINDAYFPPTNTNKFARAARYNIEALELNYHTKSLVPQEVIITRLPDIELCASCYFDIPIQFIGINEIYPYDYVSRYQISKDFEGNVLLQSQRIVFPQDVILFSEASPSEMMGVLKEDNEYFLALNTARSGADWNRLGVIENWDDNIVSMSLVKTTAANFFIAERRDQTKHLYVIESASDAQQITDNTTNVNELPELVYTLTDLGAVSVSGDLIKLVYLNGKLYLLEQSSTNFKMYSFNGTGFVEIQGTMPPQRNILNVATTGKYMFLTGGTDFNNAALTDMWRFDSETDTWTLVTNTLQGDFRKVIMQEVDGKMIAFNPVIEETPFFPVFEFQNTELVENIEISYSTTPNPNYEYPLYGEYCLNESEITIQGGIETSGTCVPFTHPFYNSFSAGATVYSLDGKGNRLYAGTNDSIKIYDISDPDSPVLVSSFLTNNARVNDLEIEGDVLFAATSKGLYKLDASDPDELEQILFVSTGSTSQNEIELYDGKVYVGDDNGIKIRDKETLSVLLSANSGQVYDFAIENGEIAMFRSSFWNSGIQFRNAETLVETAYDYTSCYDVEIENFNGRLYLACDNYTYSFEANNGYIYFIQLSGDKRDLRENYTYNGYTYTSDGSYIRLSTNEDVSAICGNGIVEGDEVCDGTPIDCAELDSSYVSGIAACNSTCNGYVLDNCTAGNGGDGW